MTIPLSFCCRFFASLTCCLFWGNILAQDPHFSQFYHTPWNLNPAMTGLHNGSWRASLIYRDQWGSILAQEPFRTFSASADGRIPVGRYDHIGVGAGALHDEARTARYTLNNVHASGAYLRRLSGKPRRASHYLGAGIQVGVGQNNIDWSRLWFSRQFDAVTEAPDPGAANGEPNANASGKPWLDFNAGVIWYALLKNEGFVMAGAALHHLNEPAVSLIEDYAETLYRRHTVHASGHFPINDELALLPGILWMSQGPAQQINLGANIRYGNADYRELALRTGAWLRMANRLEEGIRPEAVVVTGMFEWDRWMLGLSYDITVSSLGQANSNRGAFEISLSYVHPGTRKGKVACPSL